MYWHGHCHWHWHCSTGAGKVGVWEGCVTATGRHDTEAGEQMQRTPTTRSPGRWSPHGATGKVPRLRLTATQGRVGRRGSGIATGLSAPRHRWCRVGGGHPPTRAASEGARRHRVEGHDVITSRRCSAGAGKVGVREGCANATGTTRRQSFGCRIHPPRARPKSTSTQSWHTRRPDISSRHSVAGGVGVGGSERSVAR